MLERSTGVTLRKVLPSYGFYTNSLRSIQISYTSIGEIYVNMTFLYIRFVPNIIDFTKNIKFLHFRHLKLFRETLNRFLITS